MKRSADDEHTSSDREEEAFLDQQPSKRPRVENSENSDEITREKSVFGSSESAAESGSRTWVDRARNSDRQIVHALKNKYEAEQVDRECEEIKRRYLVTYMKKVIKELPLSEEIIEASKSIEEGDEFLKMYSVAKTCVHSEMQLKKLIAFNSVFDMISHVMGKGLHDRIVAPYLKSVVPQRDLDAAYDAFKDALSSDDGNSCTELHCVAYLIQNEIEKDKPLRISNPIFNRFTQQLKAASRYVTAILQSLASKPLVPPTLSSPTTTPPRQKDNSSEERGIAESDRRLETIEEDEDEDAEEDEEETSEIETEKYEDNAGLASAVPESEILVHE